MSTWTLREAVNVTIDDVARHQGWRVRNAVRWRVRRRLRQRRARTRFRRPQERLYSVAFDTLGERVLRDLIETLASQGIGLMQGGSRRATVRVLHLDANQIEAATQCLLDRWPEEQIYLRVKGRWRRQLSAATIDAVARRRKSFEILIVERTVDGEPRHVCCSRLEIAIWHEQVGAYGASYHESDRDFELVGRLRGPTYAGFMRDRHDFDDDFPAPDSPDFPIDVVYTWVDGDDPDWLAEKVQYSQGVGAKAAPKRVLRDERFRNRDELKYSLRSLEMFAPWVRQVHIVTANQTPPWLNTGHPKINLVSHKDIFEDQGWLPTFNSSGIETQLHHISGLAQKFIYFNDDFFLGQLCDPIDFFYPNGALKFFPSDQRAYEPDIDVRSEEYIQADSNAISLLKRQFPTVGRAIMKHVPYPADRDLLSEMEAQHRDAFRACAAARFRSQDDIRPIAFMQYHFGFQSSRAMPAPISHRYLALWKDSVAEQMANVEQNRGFKTFCVNDVGLQLERTEEVNEAVVRFLEAYFPAPSSFELDAPR